jgi:O-antigen biosynthesis protein
MMVWQHNDSAENSKSQPLVTVIIPTYNRADLVKGAIESVLAQSYSQWELLVVDDASTDETSTILQGMSDERIRYIRHSQNRGGSAARNTGLAQAKGAYIAFLDSDDEWLPTKLEKQVAHFEHLPLNVGLVYTGALVVRDGGVQEEQRPVHRGSLFRQLLLDNVIVGSGSAVMIRSTVLENVPAFDEALPARQDLDFWVRVAQHYIIDFVDEVLLVIYASKQSDRITTNATKVLNGRVIFLRKFEQDMRELNVLHIYLYRLGQQYQRLLGDRVAARQWYREAIKVRPWALYGYGLYALSYLPLFVYQMFDGIKRQFLHLSRK